MHAHQLRRALADHLGRELTPEIAVAVCARALAAPAPIPRLMPGRSAGLDVSQAPEHFAFINERLDAQYTCHNAVLIAKLAADGEVCAVVAFTDLRRWSIEVSVASDGSARWLSRSLLYATFSYPFEQLGLQRVTGRVQADNTAALALNEGLGFRQEGVQRRQFGEHDCVLFGMLRGECRWL